MSLKGHRVPTGHWLTHFDWWTGEERCHCACGEIFSPRDDATAGQRFEAHRTQAMANK